jgi:hypothetical protein
MKFLRAGERDGLARRVGVPPPPTRCAAKAWYFAEISGVV